MFVLEDIKNSLIVWTGRCGWVKDTEFFAFGEIGDSLANLPMKHEMVEVVGMLVGRGRPLALLKKG